MAMPRDPVDRAADEDGDVDLQNVARWEPRSTIDRFSARLHGAVLAGLRVLVVLVALGIGLSVAANGVYLVFVDRAVAVLVALSIIPAGLLAVYVYRADVTTEEPLTLVVVTFLLSVALIGLAFVVNTIGTVALGVGPATPVAVAVPFFYLVVGPVEETVKLLAVRLHAYRDDRFDAVIDGAVYGAIAGLGFATFENAYYITAGIDLVDGAIAAPIDAGATTFARTLAGPGHVIYSAIAGYYLGLAKFVDDASGPIVVKGLLIATLLHGTYNVGVSIVPGALVAIAGVPPLLALIAFVLAFDGAAGYLLYRRLETYRRTYHAVGAGDRAPATPAGDEFDPPSGRDRAGRER
ncbi:PrsW family intramembrane metalloprotease [Halobacteriales archaeon SW_7_68_16]|nr:MAG: PrsW family intramembrane metalloprotease [Halobacteriales archaeon SW_7_68_16]